MGLTTAIVCMTIYFVASELTDDPEKKKMFDFGKRLWLAGMLIVFCLNMYNYYQTSNKLDQIHKEQVEAIERIQRGLD